jgi:hypothetical protein
MKEVSETVLTYILAVHPSAQVVTRDGKRIVRVPTYDIETDTPGMQEREIVADATATPMGILPVFNIRTGPKFNPGGDAKISPLGKMFRIIGYTPPSKDDAE